MLSISNLKKSFDHFNGEVLDVLIDINLFLENKSIVALMGPNGSGKTTLMNLICGDLQPDIGNIVLNDLDLLKLSSFNRYKHIGRVHQESHKSISSNLTLDELLSIAYKRSEYLSLTKVNSNKPLKVLDNYSKTFISFYEEKKNIAVKYLSGGERQLLCLGLALLGNPNLLLLDEHLASLDDIYKSIADELLLNYKLNTQGCVLVITHDKIWAGNNCDKILELNNGIIRE